MATMTEEQRRLLLLDQIGGPTGQVTAKYGNEAGATFNVDPSNTAGLRAGAVVQDGTGSQWIVGDDYKWAPYTGAAQWQGISAADDARQKLVQDWYNTGMDPSNAQAIAAATYLGQNGRLGAVQPRAGGPITKDNIVGLKANLDASMQGGVAAAESQSTSTAQQGAKSSGGVAVGAGPGNKPTSGGSYTGGFYTGGTTGGVTEPWTGTMPSAGSFGYGPAPTYGGSPYDNRRDQLLNQLEGQQFSYDPNTDPVWQSYQMQYRREGQRATEDALGRAAGMTGGVPSSYAVGAATQAGNYYAAQLADKIPQLYNEAYNRYLAEYEKQMGLADRYNQYGEQDYNKYRDTLAQYNTDRNFAYGTYADDYNRRMNQYNTKYQEYLNEQDRLAAERSWEYGVEQDALNRAERAAETEYQHGLDAEDRARLARLDEYNQQQDAMNWWWTIRQEEYNRGQDETAQQQALREYEDQQLQQQINNAYKFISTFGYVPDWAAELLGVPAGTSAAAVGLGGSGGGGSRGTTPAAEGPASMTPEGGPTAQDIRNAQSGSEVMNMISGMGQMAAGSGEGSGGTQNAVAEIGNLNADGWVDLGNHKRVSLQELFTLVENGDVTETYRNGKYWYTWARGEQSTGSTKSGGNGGR